MLACIHMLLTFQQIHPELQAGWGQLRITGVLGLSLCSVKTSSLGGKYSVYGQMVGHRVDAGKETRWRKRKEEGGREELEGCHFYGRQKQLLC